MINEETKRAIRSTIVERLNKNSRAECIAQRDRFEKKLNAMREKAGVKGWGNDPEEWPGDAARTFADIEFYVQTFDALTA